MHTLLDDHTIGCCLTVHYWYVRISWTQQAGEEDTLTWINVLHVCIHEMYWQHLILHVHVLVPPNVDLSTYSCKKKRLSKLFLTRLKISKSTKFELYLRWFVELSVCDRRWKCYIIFDLKGLLFLPPVRRRPWCLEMAKMQTREESSEGEFCTHEWMEQRVRFVLCRVMVEDIVRNFSWKISFCGLRGT